MHTFHSWGTGAERNFRESVWFSHLLLLLLLGLGRRRSGRGSTATAATAAAATAAAAGGNRRKKRRALLDELSDVLALNGGKECSDLGVVHVRGDCEYGKKALHGQYVRCGRRSEGTAVREARVSVRVGVAAA